MKKTSLFLFVIVTHLVCAQNQQLDSLNAFIQRHTTNDTIRVNALNFLSEQYQWSDFTASLKHAEEAFQLAGQLRYTNGIATAKYLKGHCYWALGDSEIAIEMGLDAVALAEGKSETILVEAYQILARAYMDQTATDKALYYINLAESLAQKSKNWNQLSRVYNLAGVIQYVSDRSDSALQLYEKALTIANEFNLPKINSARIVSNIGECYLQNGSEEAFTYFNKALSIALETGNRAVEAGTSSVVGIALIEKGKYREAEVYLKKALALSRQLGLKRVTRHVYAGLSNLKAREGKTNEALAYMKDFYEVRDSLLNASKTRQIVEREARHELEKKEQAIKLLEQEQQLQKIWRNILLAALVLVVLTGAFIYYVLAYREKKNREILNLQIDSLTSENKALENKYKKALMIDETHEKSMESVDERLLKRAIEVVESNISDPLFGVEQMSKELGMSRTNMHRKIKAITGFPPSELIRNIRLRKAAVMLINKADTVSQISFTVGFEDHSYFSKAFKKHFGVTPSDYLQSREHQN